MSIVARKIYRKAIWTAVGMIILSASAAQAQAPDTWTLTGDMVRAAHFHAATLLPSGKVLVWGSASSELDPNANVQHEPVAQLFDPNAVDPATGRRGRFSRVADPLYMSFLHTATLLPNGKVIFIGGGAPPFGVPTSSAQIYDPATDTWSPSAGSLTIARASHQATVLPDGRILITGGVHLNPRVGMVGTQIVEIYDPTTDSFSIVGNLLIGPGGRASHAAVLLQNGKVLIAGGGGAGDNSAELYDPATNTFERTGDMTVSRGGFPQGTGAVGVLLRNGKVLIVGGTLSGGVGPALPNADLYDPATGTFTATGNMLSARDQLAATLLSDGRVLAAGGRDFGIPDSFADTDAEIYDPATETWSATTQMNVRRYLPTMTLLRNGTILVAGGIDLNERTTRTAEIYVPGPGGSACLAVLDSAMAALGVGSSSEVVPAIQSLQSQLAAANATIARTNAAMVSSVTSFQDDLRQVFADPGFVVPGATPLEQLQAIVQAVIGLNKGRKQGVYVNLGGKP